MASLFSLSMIGKATADEDLVAANANRLFPLSTMQSGKERVEPRVKKDPRMSELAQARSEAERRFPFIKKFRHVMVAPAKVKNKGGMGEFVEPDDPTNPHPGKFTITIGENSPNLQGGIADTIVADMVHAAADMDPSFQALKRELRESLSEGEISFAKKQFENKYKGKFSGSNFENFENFLSNFWLEGTVQHLLLPENSEIDEFKRFNPKAVPVLSRIEQLFKTEPR